ncbi:hypothetical protein PBRA_004463, partial [Plasmodiophora brassicae]
MAKRSGAAGLELAGGGVQHEAIKGRSQIAFVKTQHRSALREHRAYVSHASLNTTKGIRNVDARFYAALALTVVYFIVEVVVGFMFHSLALVADAMNMLSDIISMGIGLYAIVLSRRPANEKLTFGWMRTEVVGGLVNATFMLSICMTLTIDAVKLIVKPETDLAEDIDLVLWVSVGGLVANLLGLWILGTGAPDERPSDAKPARRDKNMQGVLLHVLGDALGSVGVICSSLIVKFSQSPSRFLADPLFTIIIVVVLAATTFPLMMESIKVLLQRTPAGVNVQEIIGKLLAVEDVIGIHNFHLWSLSSDSTVASMHVTMRDEANTSSVFTQLKAVLTEAGIVNITIHPEFLGDSVPPPSTLVSQQDVVCNLEPSSPEATE